MDKIDYFVLTQIITDDIYQSGALVYQNVLGGGVYTVAGMRVWAENVGICSGVGEDFTAMHGKWFGRNDVHAGVTVKHRRSVHQFLNYFSDGEREEIPQQGYSTLSEMQPLVEEIPPAYADALGMYFYKDCEEPFWSQLLGYFKVHPRMQTMWELNSFIANSEHRAAICERLPYVDMFSLNLTEGRGIFGTADPLEIVRVLLNSGAKTILFRMGKNGSLVAGGGHCWHVPAVDNDAAIVDVTGGGNSSTGGFVVGWCTSGGDLVRAGVYASVAASFIVEQHGPPAVFDTVLRTKAEQRAKQLLPEQIF